MVNFVTATAEDYSAEDFEQAAQRLLGDRYLELKALNVTPTQMCNEFSQYFFSGLIRETRENSVDVTLLLTASTDVFVGRSSLSFSGNETATSSKEAPSLTDLLLNDIAPDRRVLLRRASPQHKT